MKSTIKNDIHYVDQYVGAKLRKRRSELKISQEQLASSVQLTFQQIQKYEKGLNRISCSKLYDFARYLKTSINYFFDGLPFKNYQIGYNEAAYGVASDRSDQDSSLFNGRIQDIEQGLNERVVELISNIKDPKVKESVLTLLENLSK